MPKEWTDKQERQYEHIRDSEKDQGASTERAKEVAARTVNKNRAQAGQTRTASRTSVQDKSPQQRGGQRSGRDGPKGPTRDQLYNEARQRNIEGRSTMNKSQLASALKRKKAS
ncbi:plasmid stabilization protein [Nocardia sp. NPDC005366]|uniref:plasmid stabilization protein n=1 Tax=Nocardia sp. NPDC005366 TaxID=3156878 RepID=UPI00339E7C62